MIMRAKPRREPGKPSNPAMRERVRRSRLPRKDGAVAPAASPEPCDEAALFRLLTWLSPSFPVGAFSFSSGIEWAVEAGDIVDAAGLGDWLGAMIADGAGF